MSRLSLGRVLLAMGNYREGFPHYEWRLKESVQLAWPPSLSQWDGERLIEELVLLAEQGIGDLVQFMRYAVILRLGISKISILAPRRLHALLRHFGGFDAVYETENPPVFPQQSAGLPLLSVPRLLDLTPEAVLIDEPCLRPVDEMAAKWRQRIHGASSRPVVGFNWQGNPAAERGDLAGRSFPLETLAPLAELTNVEFVSLQKGEGSEQLQTCSFRHRFVACQELVDGCWDLVETLAILAACDVVITSDTAVAHLAGSLGLSLIHI